jgi:uncharacterized OB-fold protein
MPKQIPVPNEQNKPFWDAVNEGRLIVQNCTACNRLHYPYRQRCDTCGSADHMEWTEVEGKGHIKEYFIIRDSRIRRLMEDQPINMALVTLDQDPGLIFLANLPGTPVGEVPVGAPVEAVFESIRDTDQKIVDWKVVGPPAADTETHLNAGERAT